MVTTSVSALMTITNSTVFDKTNINMCCALFNIFIVFSLFLWIVYLLNKSSKRYQLCSDSDKCVLCTKVKTVDYTNKMKRFSRKIHKTEGFDNIFQKYKSYNKSKKEGKNFTYNYLVRNAVIINTEGREYFVMTGKYYNKNLSFIFGTDEYYENNDYNGCVLYRGKQMTVEKFMKKMYFKYLDEDSLCKILNLYYNVFRGFNDKAFWHCQNY